MTLAAGARLGRYEIVGPLGAGGMGEVYRAVDTRLKRTVAVKVLPEALAGDPQFRERFDREARAISHLTHPNICTLYDVGEDRGTAFLVMELLAGETLAARLGRFKDRPLQADEAVAIAIQITDALDCAHGAGIAHRDLKPANVFLAKTGVKLLDFGLAKSAIQTHGRADLTAAATAPAALTAEGTILGTLQYMAPEQVEGLDADARADIWAFGAILHEMITGRVAFEGRNAATLIAAVLTQKPQPVRQAQPSAPPALERLIDGCLEKDREQRWQNIRDVRRQLTTMGGVHNASPVVAPPAWPMPRATVAAGAIGVLAAGLLLGYGIAGRVTTRPSSGSPLRFEIRAPAGLTIPHTADTNLYVAPSPDGTRLAFVSGGRLWVKSLDAATATEVAGTNGASSPFWSPDARAVGFFASGQLKKTMLDGGPPHALCAVRGAGNNGTWNSSGVILFDDWGNKRLMRVSENGGAAALVRSGSDDIGWPSFLPDGRHYLYMALSQRDQTGQAFVGALDSTETTALPDVNSRVEYAAGYLLFRRDGALLAQPFDASQFKLSGSAVPLAEFVTGFASTGFAAFSTGGPSLLVYQAIKPANRLVWADREGRDLDTIGQPRDYGAVRLAPDGLGLAMAIRDPVLGTNDVWVHDFRRNIDSRLTSDKGSENSPTWTPDGRTIVYAADRRGAPHLHAREVSGSDEREVTAPSGAVQVPSAVAPDGRFVVYNDTNPDTGADVMMAPLDGTNARVPLVHTKAREMGGRPSPDGKWLSYTSNESGRLEIYVRRFGEEQGRWQISRAGGTTARWRADGRELFYVEGGTRIMNVEISAGSTFEPGAPRALFSRAPFIDYDASADGKRFVFTMIDPEAEGGTLSAILNWPAMLKK